MDKAWIKSDQS